MQLAPTKPQASVRLRYLPPYWAQAASTWRLATISHPMRGSSLAWGAGTSPLASSGALLVNCGQRDQRSGSAFAMDLRHTGNTFAAAGGVNLRDLIDRMSRGQCQTSRGHSCPCSR